MAGRVDGPVDRVAREVHGVVVGQGCASSEGGRPPAFTECRSKGAGGVAHPVGVGPEGGCGGRAGFDCVDQYRGILVAADPEKELDEVAQGGPLVVPDAHVVPPVNDGEELREGGAGPAGPTEE